MPKYSIDMKRLALAFALAVFLMSAGCTKMGQHFTLSINDDGRLVGDKSFTEDQVMDIVNGYGWLYVESKEIESQTLQIGDIYLGRMAGGITGYYFHDGIATVYFHLNSGQKCFSNYNLRYDIKRNALVLSGNKAEFNYLSILDIKDKQFCAVEYLAMTMNGTREYRLSTYRKMSDEELKEWQESFTYEYIYDYYGNVDINGW